jgi:TRAP transporter 4TM/12TM fusion protein
MNRLMLAYRDMLLAAPMILGLLWVFDVPIHLGWPILQPSYLAVVVGLSIAAAYLVYPFREKPGALEIALGGLAMWAWFVCAINVEAWMYTAGTRGLDKLIPAAIGLVLLWDSLRRAAGMGIAVLIGLVGLYGVFGHHAPGQFEGTYVKPDRLLMYLFSDTNAVLGIVLQVVGGMVLAFIALGQLMGQSGATQFFNDISLALFGRKRGGPAKVAVTASSLMGMINGTAVGNILSTGVMTIPLMKRIGFPPHVAAGVEAVASNGGQLAPPVMGATAFLIAEFLQIPYSEVALAAALPAFLYYLTVFAQVDFYARLSPNIRPSDEAQPRLLSVFKTGWVFVLPIVVLVFLLFGLQYNASKSALIAAFSNVIPVLIVNRAALKPAFVIEFFVGAGRSLLPLMLIGAAAGIVIGVMNLSGLGFNITLSLGGIGETLGLLPMLITTALLAILLGLGMPTAAVYVVVSVLLAPALERMGVSALSAHMFVLYFGLASMLTPPVAIASYVAAGIARASMWKSGFAGLALGSSSFLLPFVFAVNPALLMQGSFSEILNSIVLMSLSGLLLSHAICHLGLVHGFVSWKAVPSLVASVIVALVSIWFTENSMICGAVACVAAGYLIVLVRGMTPFQHATHQAETEA